MFAARQGATTFVSCPSTPTFATCILATPTFDLAKHLVPDVAYAQCKLYTSDTSVVGPVAPKVKQYHLSSVVSTGLTSYLDANSFCTSEGWEFGTIMSEGDFVSFAAQVSQGETSWRILRSPFHLTYKYL